MNTSILKNILAIGIVFLFIVSSVTPMAFGYDAKPVDTELEEMLDDLRFMCTTPDGFSEEKYEHYKEKLLSQYSSDNSNDDMIVEQEEEHKILMPVEPPTPVFTGGPMDSPWPMQSHNTHHTGQSPYSTADNPGIEKWRFRCEWMESSAIIDDDGIIYFGDLGIYNYFYAIYPDGAMKWKLDLHGWVWSTPAIAEDGTIYVGVDDGSLLYAIYPNGTEKWRFNAHDTIYSSPAIAEDGTIYFGTMGTGYNIYAVNPNGTEKWHYKTGYKITSDPAIGDDGTIYIGSGDSNLYAMNPNGTLKWLFHTGDEIHGHPAIGEDGTIYIGSYDDYFYAIYPNGTMKWRFNSAWGTANSAAIADDGTIYVGTNKLYAVNPDGSHKWAFLLGGNRQIGFSSPAISADGTIYVGINVGNDLEGGEFVAINPDGTEKWRRWISNGNADSSPSIAEDGTVYVGCSYEMARGYLHAFGSADSNSPPGAPSISGPTNGEVGEEHRYTLRTVDPDNNPIQLFVDWGDGDSGWVDWYASGEEDFLYHEWTEQGDYTISAKAKDVMGEEGPWGYLEVTMPVNQPQSQQSNPLLQRIFQQFPNAFPALRQILGL